MNWLDQVQWDARGLVPAIAQDATTGRVLMLAWMNREALEKTHALGQAVYWSRSRNRLWHKGEESGHVQTVREIRIDCDGDVVLLLVDQAGGIACHTGRESCFFSELGADARWHVVDPVRKSPETIYAQGHAHNAGAEAAGPSAAVGASAPTAAVSSAVTPTPPPSADVLQRVWDTIMSRRGADPGQSYVARLFAKGEDTILKKVGEEATELVLAAKDGDPAKIIYEAADLWFHSLVALAAHGLSPQAVIDELARREGLSGLAEFAARGNDPSKATPGR